MSGKLDRNLLPGKGSILSDPYFFAALGVAFLFISVELLLPLGLDNDIYQTMGLAMVRGHGLPYIGSWDHNFPGIAYIHALAIFLFGNSDFGFRMFDLIVQTLTAGLFYVLLTRWVGKKTALLAVALRAIYYVGGQFGLIGQRDGYAVTCILGAALLYYVSGESTVPRLRSLWRFCCGLFIGFLLALRPTYGLYFLLFGYLFTTGDERRRGVTSYLVGFAVIWGLILVPYAFIPGGLEQLYYSLIRFNLDLYGKVSVPVAIFERGRPTLFVLAIIGAVAMWKSGISSSSLSRRDIVLVVGCLLSGLVSAVAMGKYFDYHLEPTMMIVIALASVGFMRGIERVRLQSVGLGLVLLFVLFFATDLFPRHLFRYLYEEISRTSHPVQAVYARVLSDPMKGLTVQNEIVRYINDNCRTGEAIEFCSIDPDVRWRADRPEATRFGSLLPVTIQTSQGTYTDYQHEWRKEWINAVARVRPRYIIFPVAPDEKWVFIGEYPRLLVHHIEGFDSLLAKNYRFETIIGAYSLYRSTAP